MTKPSRTAVRFNLWQIAVLFVPLARACLYISGITPAPLAASVLPAVVQTAALSILGVAAVVSLVGVLRERSAIERIGLNLLGAVAVLYAGVIAFADFRRSILWLIVYGCIAGCSIVRSREITKAKRIVVKVLKERA